MRIRGGKDEIFAFHHRNKKNIITDPAKIKIIIKWEAFRTVKRVQKFLGFVNFYREFIKNISYLVMLSTNLKKKTRNSTGQKQRTIFFRN